MTIEWTDDALKAAAEEWNAENCVTRSDMECMRAALDAAVAAQGIIRDVNTINEIIRAHSRAEALEEAAKKIDGMALASDRLYNQACKDAAKNIRALKDKTP